jgi:hypothetical protein
MKRMLATAVVVVALAGCATGLNAATGAPASPTPSATTPGSPRPSPTASQSPTLSPPAAGIPDGPLAPGTYTAQPFAGDADMCMGQAGCTESEADNSIRVTLTVPDGWAGIGGTIWRAIENNAPPGGAGLLFSRGPWLHASERFCQPGTGAPTISTGTTVDEFVDALVEHPDLDLTRPVDVTLAGYSGTYLELQAPANVATNQDSPGPGECPYYFVWEPGIYAQGPNHLWHLWVLDVEGVRVVIRADTYPGTAREVQAELTEIVDSIRIEP